MAADKTKSLVDSLLKKSPPAPAAAPKKAAPAQPATPAAAKAEKLKQAVKSLEQITTQFAESQTRQAAPATPAAASRAPAAKDREEAPGESAPGSRREASAEGRVYQTFLRLPDKRVASEEEDQAAIRTIDRFFKCRRPSERDELIEQLAANPSRHALDFFKSAMREDPDPHVQSQAAEVLARRGFREGREALYRIIDYPEDLIQLNHAIQVLTKVDGEAFAETLFNLWHDADRDVEERCEAIFGLEGLIPDRVVRPFLDFINGIRSAESLPFEELRTILGVLVRQEAVEAVAVMEALLVRLRATPGVDPLDLEPVIEEVEGAVALLT